MGSFNYDCDGQISMFDILKPNKLDTSGFLKDIVMRGSGFENGKERIYNLYKKDMSVSDRTKAIKNEYGQGGCEWPQKESGLHGYDSFNGKGIKAEYYNENMESKEIIYTWVEVEKMIHGLIDNGKYYKQEEPPKTDSRKPFDHSCYNCKCLDRSKKKITGTHRHLEEYGCHKNGYVPGAVPIAQNYNLNYMSCGGWENDEKRIGYCHATLEPCNRENLTEVARDIGMKCTALCCAGCAERKECGVACNHSHNY